MLRRVGSALLFGYAEPLCHDAEAVGSELQWALRMGQGLPPAKQAMPAAEKHEASRSEVFLFHSIGMSTGHQIHLLFAELLPVTAGGCEATRKPQALTPHVCRSVPAEPALSRQRRKTAWPDSTAGSTQLGRVILEEIA